MATCQPITKLDLKWHPLNGSTTSQSRWQTARKSYKWLYWQKIHHVGPQMTSPYGNAACQSPCQILQMVILPGSPCQIPNSVLQMATLPANHQARTWNGILQMVIQPTNHHVGPQMDSSEWLRCHLFTMQDIKWQPKYMATLSANHQVKTPNGILHIGYTAR